MLSILLVASVAIADPPAVGASTEDPPEPDLPSFEDSDLRGIVNGEETTKWPAVVALATVDLSGRAEVFCSGTLIQQRWVITAAHCVSGEAPTNDVHVVWGSDIAGEGYTRAIAVQEVYPYPGYNSGLFTGDIAVVELSEAQNDVAPMVLNDAPIDETWTGTELTFVGYGVTSDNGGDSGVKRTTTIPINGFDPSNVLSYASDTNVCFGDSGGAAFLETPTGFELAGINAFVTPGCVGGSNGATRVDAHLAFVLEHVPYAWLEPPPDPPAGANPNEIMDFGVDGEAGLGDWPLAEGSPNGCATTHGSGWAAALALLALKRTNGSSARVRRCGASGPPRT